MSLFAESGTSTVVPLQLYQALATSSPPGAPSSPGSPSASQQKQQEEALLCKHVLPLLAVLANELHMPAWAIKYTAEMEKAAPGKNENEKMASLTQTFLSLRNNLSPNYEPLNFSPTSRLYFALTHL